jgi:hypothetical protein
LSFKHGLSSKNKSPSIRTSFMFNIVAIVPLPRQAACGSCPLCC